jgi:hypothetical protein
MHSITQSAPSTVETKVGRTRKLAESRSWIFTVRFINPSADLASLTKIFYTNGATPIPRIFFIFGS